MVPTMTKKTTDLEAARQLVADLHAELEQLPAATLAAQRSTDVGRWMELNTRAVDLPGELRDAEITMLLAEVVDAWERFDEYSPIEAATTEAFVDQHAALAEARRTAAVFLPELESAQQELALAKLEGEVKVAKLVHDQAVDAVGVELLRVDNAEARLVELGAEVPDDIDHGRPRPALAFSTTLTPQDLGALAVEAERLIWAQGGDPDYAPGVLVAGSVPPRWVAHRLGAHLFAEADRGRPASAID
ncbi:hypothetical protein BH10ACT1_BH10ACT1_33340 [soil metagenome]